MEFLAGLVLGAIAGVVVDRLWSQVESRPRMELKVGYFVNARGEKGLGYTVRNTGSTELPEYKIGMYHPRRGIAFNFLSKQSGPLLPDQKRYHQCAVMQNGSPDPFVQDWIMNEHDKPAENVEFEEFSLRVLMTNSDRVLLESSRMGNAVARVWYQAAAHGQWGHTSWEQYQAMCSRRRFGLKSWLERRREKKELARLRAEAEDEAAVEDGEQD